MPGVQSIPAPTEQPDVAAMRIEQRIAPRYTLLLRQAKLRTKHGEFLCVIRDLSETGISIRTFHPLPECDRMAIELREDCPYLIEKVWENEGEAGFRFRDSIALAEMLEDDARFPRRQIRVNVELEASVRAGSEFDNAAVVNLSQQGARIETQRIWARGQLLELSGGGLPPIRAKVRWRRDFSHGLVFEDTFTLRDFAFLLARLQRLV